MNLLGLELESVAEFRAIPGTGIGLRAGKTWAGWTEVGSGYRRVEGRSCGQSDSDSDSGSRRCLDESSFYGEGEHGDVIRKEERNVQCRRFDIRHDEEIEAQVRSSQSVERNKTKLV